MILGKSKTTISTCSNRRFSSHSLLLVVGESMCQVESKCPGILYLNLYSKVLTHLEETFHQQPYQFLPKYFVVVLATFKTRHLLFTRHLLSPTTSEAQWEENWWLVLIIYINISTFSDFQVQSGAIKIAISCILLPGSNSWNPHDIHSFAPCNLRNSKDLPQTTRVWTNISSLEASVPL